MVFDQLTQKVSHSRNVRFNEQEVGTSPVEEEPVQQPLTLDSADDPAQHPLTLDSTDETEYDLEEERGKRSGTDEPPSDAEVEAPLGDPPGRGGQ